MASNVLVPAKAGDLVPADVGEDAWLAALADTTAVLDCSYWRRRHQAPSRSCYDAARRLTVSAAVVRAFEKVQG